MNPSSTRPTFLSLAKDVISSQARNTNLVISPLSIRVVLGMVAAGSNDPTRDQILGFLKSKSIQELNSLSSHLMTHVFADGEPLGGPRLSVANSVWVDKSFRLKPSFVEIVQNYYKAASDHVDFQTKAEEVREEVNEWAYKKTNGLIKAVLRPGSVNALTRLIFANAVYFKGVWLNEFDASITKQHKFFLLNGSSIKVPFMTSHRKQRISAFDGFKVLGLPYKQGKDRNRRFSMYFFLPDSKDGLPDLLEKIDSESGFIENHIPQSLVQVGDFRIPKFKINFQFEVSEALKEWGVVLPFREGGLTEMVDLVGESRIGIEGGPAKMVGRVIDGKRLLVSEIFQKAFIEVNEKGTKAAAVTCLRGVGGSCMREIKILDFVAHHPFLFVIREDVSGVVLFIGQLLDPHKN